MDIKNLFIKAFIKLVPERIRKAIFHFAFNIAKDEFDRFAYLYAYAPNMELGLRSIEGLGFLPKKIVDIGAYEGGWSDMVKSIWPQAQIAMIEPNIEKKNILEKKSKKLNALYYSELLGAEDGKEVVFNIMESGSSVFEERSPLDRVKESRKLKKIDTVLEDWDSIDLLKIDAQGYELEILKGAQRLLKNTKSILLEVSLIEINENAPLMHDVIAFMFNHGFVAYEILEIHRRPLDRALNQIDLLFILKDSPLLADKRHF